MCFLYELSEFYRPKDYSEKLKVMSCSIRFQVVIGASSLVIQHCTSECTTRSLTEWFLLLSPLCSMEPNHMIPLWSLTTCNANWSLNCLILLCQLESELFDFILDTRWQITSGSSLKGPDDLGWLLAELFLARNVTIIIICQREITTAWLKFYCFPGACIMDHKYSKLQVMYGGPCLSIVERCDSQPCERKMAS